MSDGGLLTRFRTNRGSLIILAIGIVGFGFLAHEDRTARHAAGIDDTCAWFQMVNRQFPMNRCFSLDEFFSMLDRSERRSDAPPSGDRHAHSEERSGRDGSACEQRAGTEGRPSNRPRGLDYVYGLLAGGGCSDANESSADE